MNKETIFIIFFLLRILTFAVADEVFKSQFIAVDTVIEINVVTNNQNSANKLFTMVRDEIGRLDGIFSNYKPGSITSQINKNAGIQPIIVPPLFFTVIENALKAGSNSNGAFDITVGPLIDEWQIAKEPHQPPSTEKISAILSLVNYKDVIISPTERSVFLKNKGMKIDLGGIAKGFILDFVIVKIKEAGIKAALVNIGGDIRAYGKKPDGNYWEVGIEHPRSKERSDKMISTLELVNESIATSGDYQRFFEWNGKRYHHIFDPHTGYPADKCVSVSIIAKTAMISDALATAVFVLGPEAGQQLLKKYPGTKALIITAGPTQKDGLKIIRYE